MRGGEEAPRGRERARGHTAVRAGVRTLEHCSLVSVPSAGPRAGQRESPGQAPDGCWGLHTMPREETMEVKVTGKSVAEHELELRTQRDGDSMDFHIVEPVRRMH